MAGIEEAMKQGLNGIAAQELQALLSWKPGSDEAWYLLGVCEASRQRQQEAEDAWSRISPGSKFAPQAIQGRMQIQMDLGRLAEAEQIVRNGLADPRIDGSGLPLLLAPVYCLEGRVEETLQLLETRWEALNQAREGASEPAINLVRAHIDLRLNPIPIEAVRTALDHAALLAPDDDRVWLGKANLFIRIGSYDEAEHWIDSCLRRRPDDVPVWRARLDWAMATSRVAAVEESLEHLPGGWIESGPATELGGLVRRKGGDVKSERRALQRLITDDPRMSPPSTDWRNWRCTRASGRMTPSSLARNRDRSTSGALLGAVPADPTGAGRSGDGPHCFPARPKVRRQSLPDRGGLCRPGSRRLAQRTGPLSTSRRSP